MFFGRYGKQVSEIHDKASLYPCPGPNLLTDFHFKVDKRILMLTLWKTANFIPEGIPYEIRDVLGIPLQKEEECPEISRTTKKVGTSSYNNLLNLNIDKYNTYNSIKRAYLKKSLISNGIPPGLKLAVFQRVIINILLSVI